MTLSEIRMGLRSSLDRLVVPRWNVPMGSHRGKGTASSALVACFRQHAGTIWGLTQPTCIQAPLHTPRRVTDLLRMLEARPNGLGERFESALERGEKLPVAAASNRAVDGDHDEIKGAPGSSHDYPLAKKLLEPDRVPPLDRLVESGRVRLLSQKGLSTSITGIRSAATQGKYLSPLRVRIANGEDAHR